MPVESTTQAPIHRRAVVADFAFLSLLLVAWYIYVGPIVIRDRMVGSDVFRDVGSAMNILHGEFLTDPAYVGETIWYPPLGAALAAVTSRLFDVPPEDYFRWSPLFLNWLIPVGLYVVVRITWNRRAAVVSTVALLLAMPWWQVEVAHGQSAIHAVVGGWVSLLLYAQAERRRSYGWAVACGAWQGLSFWHHPFVPAVLAAAFVLQADWTARRSGEKDEPAVRQVQKQLIGRNAIVAGVTLLIAAPILFLILRGPVLNPDPREYIAGELATVRFAILGGNPWLWGMGLAGVVACARSVDRGPRLLLCCLLLTVVGQVPGYLRLYSGEWAKSVPILVPHEFQRLFQLGWAMAIGIGVDSIIDWITARVAGHRKQATAASGLTIAACLLTGIWWVGDVPENLRRYLVPIGDPPGWVEAGDWVRRHAELNDVFACEPDLALRWLNAKTGRKAWIVPPGHSNPRVDWWERARVLRLMGEAPTAEALWRLAQKHDIQYLVPSPNWNPVPLRNYSNKSEETARYFRVAYQGSGAMPIYEVLPKPEGRQSDP